MKILYFFLTILMASSIFAQNEPEPDAKMPAEAAEFIYSNAREAISSKRPSKESFPNLKPETIPVSMLDTLRKYDWVALGDYHYEFGTFSDDWNPKQNNFQVDRFLSNGMLDYYICSKTTKPPTLTFNYRPKITNIRVEKIGNFHYIVQDKKNDKKTVYSRLISFKNGVLIYDISETGTLKDATSSMRFRNVYLAVPKKF